MFFVLFGTDTFVDKSLTELQLPDLSIGTEKSYAFQFKDTSLDSIALNPLDILPRQNWVGKLTFLLLDSNLKISF